MQFLNTVRASLAANKRSQVNLAANAEKTLAVIGGTTVTDANVVNTWLFAREAEAMGIAVDDKTIAAFSIG